jgi:hypothetical protein
MDVPQAARSRLEEWVLGRRQERAGRALGRVPVSVSVPVSVQAVSPYPRVIPRDRCLPESSSPAPVVQSNQSRECRD